ncbi:MAG: endonuclease/exonuclease/phosphatase family protein [Cyclobacteriaceae bacterium]
MRKTLGLFFALFIFAFVLFYFWASGSNRAVTHDEMLISNQSSDVGKGIGDTLTAISYNLGYLSGMINNMAVEREENIFHENLTLTNQLFAINKPDIVGFQEIDIDSKRSFNYNQVDSISSEMGDINTYTSLNWDKKYVPFPYWPLRFHFGKIISGQSVFSRFPIRKAESQRLIKPLNAPFYYNDFYLDRLIQKVFIVIGDQEVLVMNVHLEAFDTETRQVHFETVKQQYLKYAATHPVILMGDFNSNFEDQEVGLETLLALPFLRVCYDTPIKKYLTFSSEKPTVLLDYIFYNDNWIEKVDVKILKEAGQISDHLPVMMRFVIKDKNAR